VIPNNVVRKRGFLKETGRIKGFIRIYVCNKPGFEENVIGKG
jgi:hypothetical protein